MTQISARQRFASVRARLMELELWDADSLVMTAPGAVCSAAGEPVEAALFSAVSAPMAVFTAGRYAREFAKDPHALCAETDDAAQMFGVRVPVRSAPRRGDAACIVPNRGFVVTARFENELIAACILLEKLCMTALLSRRIGTPKPLAAPLCLIEHAVYTKKYSRPSLAAAQGEEAAPVAQDVSDLALRESVIAYGKKLVENRLIQATWGNVSARIDADRFLITPSGVDYDRIRPEDIVEIRIADGELRRRAAPFQRAGDAPAHLCRARRRARRDPHALRGAANVRRVPGESAHAGDRRPLRRLRRERLEEARGERVRGAALSRSLHHGKSRLYRGSSGS